MKVSRKQQLQLQIKQLQEQLARVALTADSDSSHSEPEYEESEGFEIKSLEQQQLDEIIDGTKTWVASASKRVRDSGNKIPVQDHLVYCADTQVGKTDAIINTIRGIKNTLVVISCDDKYAQLGQMASRFDSADVLVFSIRQRKKIMQRLIKRTSTIVLVLNTAAQVAKINCFLSTLTEQGMGLLVINDEGDTVNKCDDIVCKPTSDTAESDSKQLVPRVHEEWINLIQNAQRYKLPRVKRLWVTATPENITSLYKLDCNQIKVLPTPIEYRPITNHKKWGAKDADSFQQLQAELERIRDGGCQEVILYCVDKQNASQLRIARSIATTGNAVSIVYNGKETRVIQPANEFDPSPFEFTTKESIAETLDRVKELNLPIVVVGMLLMNRGISFVSGNSDENPPVAATTMFYSGGSTTYGVSLLQKFGRITGTARPDLETRTVYCLDEDWDAYSNALRNQHLLRDYIKTLPGDSKISVHDAMQNIAVGKMNRDIEKTALRRVNKEYSEIIKQKQRKQGETLKIPETKVKRLRLVQRWNDPKNDDTIAQFFRIMKQRPGYEMEKQEIRSLLPTLGSREKTYIYNLTDKNHSTQWCLVFEETEDRDSVRICRETAELM